MTHTPMRPFALLLSLCAALAGTGTAGAQSRTYALDPVHTRVMFAVDHAGFSRAIGTVSGSTGTLRFDPDDWTTARLEAWVPLQRVDLGDDAWNRATLATNLLDAQRHPYAIFVSDRVEPLDDDRASVHGTLTLRGVTVPVVLDVTLNALKRHPMPPFRRTIGFSATATLQRGDFGISAWPAMIGGEVELRIEAEASHAPRAEFTGEAEPAPPEAIETDPDEDADGSPAEPHPDDGDSSAAAQDRDDAPEADDDP